MSIKTSQLSEAASPHPGTQLDNAAPSTNVDTSNLTPGAAARYEKLMQSIDDFTSAVERKAITLPERRE